MDVSKIQNAFDLENVHLCTSYPSPTRYVDGTNKLVLNAPGSTMSEHRFGMWFMQTEFMDKDFPFESLTAFSLLGLACEIERVKLNKMDHLQVAARFQEILQDPAKWLSALSTSLYPLHKSIHPQSHSRKYMREVVGKKEPQDWQTHCRRFSIRQGSRDNMWSAELDFMVDFPGLGAMSLAQKGVGIEKWNKGNIVAEAKDIYMACEIAGSHPTRKECLESLEKSLTLYGFPT